MEMQTTNSNVEIANPLGTDGFEFVEFTAPGQGGIKQLKQLFTSLGFCEIAKHKAKTCWLYRQGQTNFILNAEPGSQASAFAKLHGPSVCGMAFKVKDAASAHRFALTRGGRDYQGNIGPMELSIPSILGIGDSTLYFVQDLANASIYDVDFLFYPDWQKKMEDTGVGLTHIDHLTHNVNRGHLDKWAHFYERLGNFREIRYFDIEGKHTGLKSRAMTSPCGNIRIPINESSDDKSQIEEYLHQYNGEGIQHIALSTDNIYETVYQLRLRGAVFMSTPDTYYESVESRVSGHCEDLARLQQLNILIDGDPSQEGILLQIFTETVIGPVFFEIIQRKGNQGFGEGNFQALFESIERDQIRRGVLNNV